MGYIACTRYETCGYTIFVRKPELKGPLCRLGVDERLTFE